MGKWVTYFHMFIDLINKSLEEIKRILLFMDVYRLTPQFKYFPKTLRFMILKLAIGQVSKNLLYMVIYAATRKRCM